MVEGHGGSTMYVHRVSSRSGFSSNGCRDGCTSTYTEVAQWKRWVGETQLRMKFVFSLPLKNFNYFNTYLNSLTYALYTFLFFFKLHVIL